MACANTSNYIISVTSVATKWEYLITYDLLSCKAWQTLDEKQAQQCILLWSFLSDCPGATPGVTLSASETLTAEIEAPSQLSSTSEERGAPLDSLHTPPLSFRHFP